METNKATIRRKGARGWVAAIFCKWGLPLATGKMNILVQYDSSRLLEPKTTALEQSGGNAVCQDRRLVGNSHHRRRTAATVVGARSYLLTKTPLLVDHGHLARI